MYETQNSGINALSRILFGVKINDLSDFKTQAENVIGRILGN